jgi:hypothetical protein
VRGNLLFCSRRWGEVTNYRVIDIPDRMQQMLIRRPGLLDI